MASATTGTKRKFYQSKFNHAWTETYPIRGVSGDPYKFYCIPCCKKLSCDHQGLKDVTDHCKKETHKSNVAASKTQSSMTSFIKSKESNLDKQVLNAEVMVTNFLVQHNIPLLTADHLSSLFKTAFPDSKIAQKYSSRRTKTTAMINKSFAPHCIEYIAEHCKHNAYSVGTDGSNDTGLEKMNPICVKIFDVKRSKTVTNHFLDMCLTSGTNCSTAEGIFTAIDEAFEKNKIPWENCVSLSVDNTNTMIGKNNSIASRFLEKNENVFVAGCPCHLAHIAASNAHDDFCEYISLNIEDLMVDLFYWFDKSAKRKGKLKEYFDFCDQEYQSVLKHLSVRWLSLEKCISRTNLKFTSLKAYFLSESFADERFQRLCMKFTNPLLEPCMLFLSSALLLFTHFNQLLQREEPTIHILKSSMESLGKKLAKRIMLPIKVKEISSISDIDLDDPENFMNTQDIYV